MAPEPARSREGRPTIRQMVLARAELLRQVRAFFDDRGFCEVQPPCLSREQVVDAYIDPVELSGRALMLPAGDVAERYFLQTSPEFAMKRLLGQGSGSIYAISPVFRAGERSPRHNLEFTMLEWYDVGGCLQDVIEQTIALVTAALAVPRPELITYRQLFQRYLDFDPIDEPLATLHRHTVEVDRGLADSIAGDRDAMLDVLLTERIEPAVGAASLLIHHYPLTQAALARPSDIDPATAERFEWMIGGLEIANGYGELMDAEELLRRNHANNAKRLQSGRGPLPVEGRLLAAMREGLPPCSGVALGFDRLLMLRMGVDDIADVLPLPIEIA